MSAVVLPSLPDDERAAYQLAIEEWVRVLARAHYTVEELAEAFVAAELRAFEDGRRAICAALGDVAGNIAGRSFELPKSEADLRSFLLCFATHLFARAATNWRQTSSQEPFTAEQRLAYAFHEGD